MKRISLTLPLIASLAVLSLIWPTTAMAQSGTNGLSLSTTYPTQVAQLGETVNFKITLKAGDTAQTVDLSMEQLPDGWKALFRGGGRVIRSVFIEANSSQSVDLHLEPPEDAKPGTYTFMVAAQGNGIKATLPITLIVQDKVPANLSLTTELPTLKGLPSTTFRYNTKIRNEGDQDLTITLNADTPDGFMSKFMLSGQEVTSFPLGANQSRSLSIEMLPVSDISAGEYPLTVYANGGDLQATLNLTAQVSGQYALNISGQDGRLSETATVGKATTFQVIVHNDGTAPVQGVALSASAPNGWQVSFDPKEIGEIPAGQQVEVTANLQPADKAIAGDYVVTVKAKPVNGATKSADFRITVTTSTLWGFAGLALIAIAVGVVALAVTRFGRR